MPYIDVYVDDDQFENLIVDEIDFALSEDREVDSDPELRRAMMIVRNYFSNQPELVQRSFPFMQDYPEMNNELSSQPN